MARKPAARAEFDLFDVFYADGSQRSKDEFDRLLGDTAAVPRADRTHRLTSEVE